MIHPLLKYWMPALIVAVLITIFSTHYFSAQQTARVIYPVLLWLFPSASQRSLHLMHIGIRKMAHVSEFGIFSITVFRGVRGGRSGWRPCWAVVTLLIAVGYAAMDEWHQSFVPLRHASFRDVIIDAVGALLAQILVWAYANWQAITRRPGVLPARPTVED